MADKTAQKRQFLDEWFSRYGERLEDTWQHRCQSCGRSLWRQSADPSHKIPAGRGGDKGGEVQPGNLIASCRPCHDWLERGPDWLSAREWIIDSPASLENDLLVEWPIPLWKSLRSWLAKILLPSAKR